MDERAHMEEIQALVAGSLEAGNLKQAENILKEEMEQAAKREAYGLYIASGYLLLELYDTDGQYENAWALSEDLLLLMEELKLEETEHFARVLYLTAGSYVHAGKDAEAEVEYERASQILYARESVGMRKADSASEYLGVVLTEWALCLLRLGKAQKAHEIFKKAVSYYESKDPLNEQDRDYYMTALSGLGEDAWNAGDADKALQYYERALEQAKAAGADAGVIRIFEQNCESVGGRSLSRPQGKK